MRRVSKVSNTTIDARRRDKLTARSTNLSSIVPFVIWTENVTAAITIVRSSLCPGTHKGSKDLQLKVKRRRSIAPGANVRYDRRHSGSYKPVQCGPGP